MKYLHIISLSFAIVLGLSSYSQAQINHTVSILLPGHLPPPSICMVTVDPLTEKNRIVWEKTYGIGITSYNVYREVKIRNNFVFMGNVPFYQLPAFSDINSFPQKQQYRYKISVIDSCGNESAMSPDIEPFFLAGFTCSDGNCLTWEPSRENEVDCIFNSVIIYRGNDPVALLPVDTISSFNKLYVDLKENLPYNKKTYYRIGGVKDVACDPDLISDKNAVIIYNQALSNLVSIHRDPNNIEIVNYPGKISISPNPFETETLIKWENSPGGNSDLFLYDMKGTLIKKVEGLKKIEYKLNRDNLQRGFYIIEVRGEKRFYGKIFVI
jgi:hypothetical protein